MDSHLYIFTLGHAWKLSLSELIAIFGMEAYQTHTPYLALFRITQYTHDQLAKKFLTIGGSLRIIKIIQTTTQQKFATDVIDHIIQSWDEKFNFALGAYGVEFRLSDIGLRIKKTLQTQGKKARLVNTSNTNINAASFKKSRLGKIQHEYNLITIDQNTYLGVTIACQDIDAYANRDMNKSRDMIVGMMPPKLTQIMINIATSTQQWSGAIYDPFCGLGTTLIESANMNINHLYGSDISADMVQSSKDSLQQFIESERVWQDRIRASGGTPHKDFSSLEYHIFRLDASHINQAFDQHEIPTNVTIVSEWFLGAIMSASSISLQKIQSEKRKLTQLYHDFFVGLEKSGFCGTIVMSFPFWNIDNKYVYFDEIYNIIDQSNFCVVPLLPPNMQLNTKSWSLLYRRESQTVGREIIKITRTPWSH